MKARILAALAVVGLLVTGLAAPAQASTVKPNFPGFDRHIYYAGQWISGWSNTYPLGIVSTSGTYGTVAPGRDTSSVFQSTDHVVTAPWYYGSSTYRICYRIEYRANPSHPVYTRSAWHIDMGQTNTIWASPNRIGQCSGA